MVVSTPKYTLSARTHLSLHSTAFTYFENDLKTWWIGTVFLKNVYSVFQLDPPQIGFASLQSGIHLPNVTVTSTSTAPSSTSTKKNSSGRQEITYGNMLVLTYLAAAIGALTTL